MEKHEPTIANADLWARYFQDEWSRWLSPLGSESLAQMADGTAARVASFLTLVAAGPIAWLYHANAPQVTQAAVPALRAVEASSEAQAVEEAA